MNKSIKTIGDLANRGENIIVNLRKHDINDWRPACDMYIDDIVFVKENECESRHYPIIPGEIRFWLNNGDSIIYVMGGMAQ